MVTSTQTITPRAISINGCDLFIGTSGFSYPEWIDSGFYPEKTKSGRMPELYCRAFSAVELNYTWCQMARPEIMERMLMQVDKKKFWFTTKLTRTITREINGNWKALARTYVQEISPLLSAGRLLAMLIQFPPSCHRTLNNRQYLARLLDCLQDLPQAVEFRHCSWAVEPVFSSLQEHNVTLVTVDLPALPSLFSALNVVTNPLFFTFACMDAMQENGFQATCTNSSITAITSRNSAHGRNKKSRPWPDSAIGVSSFSTTMWRVRPCTMPVPCPASCNSNLPDLSHLSHVFSSVNTIPHNNFTLPVHLSWNVG